MEPTQLPSNKNRGSERGGATSSLAQESFPPSFATYSGYTRSQIKFLILRNDFLSEEVKKQARTNLDGLLEQVKAIPLVQKKVGFGLRRLFSKARREESSPALPLSQLRELKEVVRQVESIPPRLSEGERASLDFQIEYQIAALDAEYRNNALASLLACGPQSAATKLALTAPHTMDSALQLAKKYFQHPSNQAIVSTLDSLLSSVEALGERAPLFRELRLVLNEIPELPRHAGVD